ncbi:MAG: hypothetical protein AB2598_19550 [Candidatus Thiodiazotropha sp.]
MDLQTEHTINTTLARAKEVAAELIPAWEGGFACAVVESIEALQAEVRQLPDQADPITGTEALTGKYGDVLGPFVQQMEAKLHANADKGDRPGWLSMTRDQAMLEIYYHTAKLQKAVKDNDIDLIREHSADVANMSMMMLDVCGGI